MNDPNEIALRALRDAVRAAPRNVELADSLGRTLLAMHRHEEASEVYRQALQHRPGVTLLQLGLADAYRRLGKGSHALAIVETLLGSGAQEASVLVMHSRLMQAAGEHATAVASYREAIDADPTVADPELESLLGFRSAEGDAEEQETLQATWQDLPEDPPEIEAERPSVTFAEVGGMEQVKEEIRVKILYPLQHPEIYAAYGKKIGGGILLYGPPGCGKTHLARATAGEVRARFLSVGISDVLDMWIGASEKNLHSLFEQARRSKPCVLFFDEVDALGASRSDMKRSGGRQLINQFLSELDGVETDNEGVLCLAATNAPWHLDSAFRRPGRFDRVVFVPPPDRVARAEILQLMLAGKPTEGIDYAKLADKTEDFSGADLRAVVDRAVEDKLRQAVKTGLPKPISTKDLLGSAKEVRPSAREWFSTARNHALYANEGGLYDEILDYLKIKR